MSQAATHQQTVAAGAEPTRDKYDEVIFSFVALMVAELHANSSKGDRPGWLSMSPEVAMLEIYYHAAKLQKAAKDNNPDLIREYGADVANMAMMLVDVCGALPVDRAPAKQPVQVKALTDDLYILSMNEEAMEEAIQRFKGSSTGEALKAVFAAQKSLRALLASQPSAQADVAVGMDKIGTMGAGGVIWHNKNPHAWPVGTVFYAHSAEEAA